MHAFDVLLCIITATDFPAQHIGIEEYIMDSPSCLESSRESKLGIVPTQQKSGTESNVSHTVELIKQVSENVGEIIITALEETRRQISEGVEKTGELVHQLSAKDDERQGQFEHLKDDVSVIISDIIKVKEEIQQKGIIAVSSYIEYNVYPAAYTVADLGAQQFGVRAQKDVLNYELTSMLGQLVRGKTQGGSVQGAGIVRQSLRS